MEVSPKTSLKLLYLILTLDLNTVDSYNINPLVKLVDDC